MKLIAKIASCLALAAGFEHVDDEITSLLQHRTHHHGGAHLHHHGGPVGAKPEEDKPEEDKPGDKPAVCVLPDVLKVAPAEMEAYVACLQTNCEDTDPRLFDGSGEYDCGMMVAMGCDSPCAAPAEEYLISDVCQVTCQACDDAPAAQPAAQAGTQSGYVGCYVDDANRDMQEGPMRYGYTIQSCAVACLNSNFFALQHDGWCVCGDAYGTESQYVRRPDSECGGPCEGETRGFCGGAWRNAIYRVPTQSQITQAQNQMQQSQQPQNQVQQSQPSQNQATSAQNHVAYGQPCDRVTGSIAGVPVCTVSSGDGNANPWVLFGDIDNQVSNFGASQVTSSPTQSGVWQGDSVQVGTFSTGEVGSPGYSLDIGQFCTGSCSANFDLMIQYGDADVDSHAESGYSTTDGGFINNGPTLGQGSTIGEHGLWGSMSDNPNGYYATFCAYAGSCRNSQNDFWQFSTNGVYPSGSNNVPCGFYSYRASWKNCPNGDNVRRMRYYVRSADLQIQVGSAPQPQWQISANVNTANPNLQAPGQFSKKTVGSNVYDAWAFLADQTEISVVANQNSGHVRLGLTSDSSDDHVYANGRYVGLFPGGRMYLPPFPDNSYTTSDLITVRLSGGRLSVLKNGAVLGTWSDTVTASKLFAKLHFYEPGVGMRLASPTSNGASLMSSPGRRHR